MTDERLPSTRALARPDVESIYHAVLKQGASVAASIGLLF
jgi:hypothetical protein